MPFLLHKTDSQSKARRGTFTTPHGQIETPMFMPVGTQGAIKGGCDTAEVKALGASIILGNTYHLSLRPTAERIARLGGLHAFAQWDGSILTDSGGYQVFSLAKLRKITREGVRFQSHHDGSAHFLSPERSMEIQSHLGSDIAMLFDECPPYPCERKYAEESLELTQHWAERCWDWVQKEKPQVSGNKGAQQHFGIVQGSVYQDLREQSARAIAAMPWDGYAIGGLSVGEPEKEMMQCAEWSVPFLPEDKPRYAMGLGTPPQLLKLIARGVDLFDCVMPTRLARHGTVFTQEGTMNLKNKKFEDDPLPLEEDVEWCPPLVQKYSRAYIRHLFRSGEMLALRLMSLQNLHFFLTLMRKARKSIEEECFQEFSRDFIEKYQQKG